MNSTNPSSLSSRPVKISTVIIFFCSIFGFVTCKSGVLNNRSKSEANAMLSSSKSAIMHRNYPEPDTAKFIAPIMSDSLLKNKKQTPLLKTDSVTIKLNGKDTTIALHLRDSLFKFNEKMLSSSKSILIFEPK